MEMVVCGSEYGGEEVGGGDEGGGVYEGVGDGGRVG